MSVKFDCVRQGCDDAVCVSVIQLLENRLFNRLLKNTLIFNTNRQEIRRQKLALKTNTHRQDRCDPRRVHQGARCPGSPWSPSPRPLNATLRPSNSDRTAATVPGFRPGTSTFYRTALRKNSGAGLRREAIYPQ